MPGGAGAASANPARARSALHDHPLPDCKRASLVDWIVEQLDEITARLPIAAVVEDGVPALTSRLAHA